MPFKALLVVAWPLSLVAAIATGLVLSYGEWDWGVRAELASWCSAILLHVALALYAAMTCVTLIMPGVAARAGVKDASAGKASQMCIILLVLQGLQWMLDLLGHVK